MRVSPKLGRYPHFACAVAAFALAVGAPVSHASAADDTGLSLWSKTDMDTRISNLELVKLLNLYLGGAQQLNIYDDACYGGGLLNAATGLTMLYFIGVGESIDDLEPFTALLESSPIEMAATNAAHLSSPQSLHGPLREIEVEPSEETLSGNTVNLEQQMIDLGDVNRDFAMSANIRRVFHQLIRSALK